MPLTLAEAQKNTQDALQMGVIDEFRKSSWLLDNLIFDDAVSPTGGGATLTYAYTRLTTQPTAGFRAVNSEYTPAEVTKERHSCDLKIFGGSFQLDRIISKMGGIVNEVQLQMEQKIKAAKALFNDTVINGDSGVDEKAFDGLDKALTGSSTEYIPTTTIDLSTSDLVDKNWKMFTDELDEFLSTLQSKPSFIGGNTKMINKIKACGKRAGQYQQTLDSFGRKIDAYDGIPLVDFGEKAGTNEQVVKTSSEGETSIYAACLGLDGFHAVSLAGDNIVNTWLPNFDLAGAVKSGEVEMVAAVALKATKAAGVMRKIKVV